MKNVKIIFRNIEMCEGMINGEKLDNFIEEGKIIWGDMGYDLEMNLIDFEKKVVCFFDNESEIYMFMGEKNLVGKNIKELGIWDNE